MYCLWFKECHNKIKWRINRLFPQLYRQEDDEDVKSCGLRDTVTRFVQSPCGRIVDWLFVLFIITPLHLLAWRGMWGLTDAFVFPEHIGKRAAVCYFVGHSLHFAHVLACDRLQVKYIL
jgi:hypothetical protein